MEMEANQGSVLAREDGDPYDLCLLWTTEHDAGFVELLDTACRARGLSLLQITPVNLERSCEELAAGRLAFRALLDRASDEDRAFLPVVDWALRHDVYRINPLEQARRSWDKAGMHTAVSERLPTPVTFYLPPYSSDPELPELDLGRLGPTFVIKPAHGGGGQGVVTLANSIEQVTQARQEQPDDMYMLQSRVVPCRLAGRPAWFRAIYADGKVYPSWWDFDSRSYVPVTVAQEAHFGLEPIRQITNTLAAICELQLFSTEIAIDLDNQFIVVDYVNDPIDLTLASKQTDGVPDDIVVFIADDLASLVVRQTTDSSPESRRERGDAQSTK